jgi:NTP pyrophosphatase (non-canonical NTP hydrolase)
MASPEKYDEALDEVINEALVAAARFDDYNSAHEGWAVMFEEVEELWEEVRKKKNARSLEAMRKEAMQVAATAIRFMAELTT